MFSGARTIDPALAAKFDVISSTDPAEFSAHSRISSRLPGSSRYYDYHLRDRALWRRRFDEPIYTMADRSAGAIEVCLATNRFSTEVTISGNESSVFVVAMPSKGVLTLLQDGAATTASEACCVVMRPGPRARALFSDAGARANIAFKGDSAGERECRGERVIRPGWGAGRTGWRRAGLWSRWQDEGMHAPGRYAHATGRSRLSRVAPRRRATSSAAVPRPNKAAALGSGTAVVWL